jgi:hypothetical protein
MFITSAQIILAPSSSFYMSYGRILTHINTSPLRFLSIYFVSSICLLVTGQILLFWVVPWVSFVWDSIEMRFGYRTYVQSCIWMYYYGILNNLFLVVCSLSIRLLCVLQLALLCPLLCYRIRWTWCCFSTQSKFYINLLHYPMVMLCVFVFWINLFMVGKKYKNSTSLGCNPHHPYCIKMYTCVIQPMKLANKAVANLWCGNEVLNTEIELWRNSLCPC